VSFLRPKPPSEAPNPAAAEAAQLGETAVARVNEAHGASWYRTFGNEVDLAVVELCRLRRAAAGSESGVDAGDAAVRTALGAADAEAVVWLASRIVSYMDEQGYPETLAPWL